MAHLSEVHVTARPLQRFEALLGHDAVERTVHLAETVRVALAGHTVWNINSAAGGGVAELLRAILPYARGANIDARWIVIAGPPAFFDFTKRLHLALHGE